MKKIFILIITIILLPFTVLAEENYVEWKYSTQAFITDFVSNIEDVQKIVFDNVLDSNNQFNSNGIDVSKDSDGSIIGFYNNNILTFQFRGNLLLPISGIKFSGCKNLTTIEGLKYLDTSNVTSMIKMFDGCSSLTSLNVSNFNTSNVTSMNYMFRECSSLTSLDVSNFDTSKVTRMEDMFNDCSSLTSLDLSGFNTSNVTNMDYMFNKCSSLTSLNLSNFNTSNVTTMFQMFCKCSSLTSLNVSNFDTSKVTNMSNMFYKCSSLTSIDLSNFNTSNVKYMSGFFHDCSLLTSLDLSNFDTSNVTNINYMFYNCSSLASLDLSKFNTSNVTTMYNMFYNCSSLTSLDVSKINTSKVENMGYMFYNCSSLINIDVSSFDTSNVTNTSYMFYNCSLLTSLNLSNFNVRNVTSMKSMFSQCSKLTSLDLSKFNTSNVTDMSLMFRECLSLTDLDLSNFNTSNVTTMEGMFNNCSKLTSLNLSNFNTSNVTNMESMFYGCSSLMSINLSSFNTSNVTNMASMFYGCSKLTSLDLSKFNTSNVTNMTSMFWGCSSLTNLNLSSFNTSNVTTMYSMFNSCSSLISLDVSNFNTSNVATMERMFYKCTSLTSLDVSKFNTSKVTNVSFMFNNCSSLTKLDVSKFNTSNVISMTYMFEGCKSLTELDLSNFDMSKVTGVSLMFANCDLLKTIYVSPKYDWTKIENKYSIFANSTNLEGQNGFKYAQGKSGAEYAVIDTEETPGYFSVKNGGTVVTLIRNNNKVTLNWQIRDCTKYIVYRSETGKTGTWKSIAKITDKNTTTYIDKSLTYGKKYYYIVAVDNGTKKINSDPVNTTIKPEKVLNGKVDKQLSTTVTISFDKVSVTGYEIYRSTKNETGTWTKVTTITSNSTLTFKDKGLKSNKTYYYKVRAYKSVNGKNYYGNFSDAIVAKTGPSKSTIKIARDYNTVVNNIVKLNYNINYTKSTGATTYKLYYSLKEDTDFVFYKDLESITALDNRTYVFDYRDIGSKFELGKTYYFRVKTFNSDGGESTFSNAVKLIPRPVQPEFFKVTTKKGLVIFDIKPSKVKVDGYELYYKTSSGYKLLKELAVNEIEESIEMKATSGKTNSYSIRSYIISNGERIYSPYYQLQKIKIK